MKHGLISVAACVLAIATPALAAGPGSAPASSSQASAPSGTHTPGAFGQPNQTCGSDEAPFTPGESIFAPGSAFNPGGIAGMMYAGEQPQNSRNPASVSQYDVACANQP
jgi:hypothetical protein